MNLARSCALGLILLGILGTAVGLVLPWDPVAPGHPDLATSAAIGFVGPLLSGVCLGYARGEPGRLRLTAAVAGVGGLVAVASAVTLARLVEPGEGVGLGGPVTVTAAACTALGWAVAAIAGPGPLETGRPALVAGAALLPLLAVCGFTISWYREGRFVDAVTGPAPAGEPAAWLRTTGDGTLVGSAGPHVFVLGADGVTAYAAATGRPGWHYRRTDLPARAAGVVGRSIVTVFGNEHGVRVVGHDARSGEERFSRRYTGTSLRPTRVVPAGERIVLAGTGPDAGELVAVAAGTGERAWSWQPRRDGAPCDVTAVAATGAVTAVGLRCRATGVRDLVVGLSTVDGKERWTWPADAGAPRGAEPDVHVVGSGFLVHTGTDRRAVLLDERGAAGAGHSGTGYLVGLRGSTAVYGTGSDTDATFSAVRTDTGEVDWRTKVPALARYAPVAGTITGDTALVLVQSSGGAIRVVGTDLANGRTTSDVAVPCSAPCARPTLTATEAGIVVATHAPGALTLTRV